MDFLARNSAAFSEAELDEDVFDLLALSFFD